MLVLTRKVEEKIRIGADIVITVTRLRNDKVRIGIEAPSSVPIFRGELLERIGPGVHEVSVAPA